MSGQHNEPDVFGKFARYLAERVQKCTSVSGVIDLMADPFIRQMVNDLPQDKRDQLRQFAYNHVIQLGWPRRVRNARGEEDQRPAEEIEEGQRR